MSAETIVKAEVLARSRLELDGIALTGRVSSKVVTQSILDRVNNDNTDTYAIRLAMPSHIKGAVVVKSFNNAGESLDRRKFAINTMPDGTASLVINMHDGAVGKWRVLGVLISAEVAHTFGELWTQGVIDIEFQKK